jgi:toxin ParE1/3/4
MANLIDFPLAGAPRGLLAPGLRAAFAGRHVIYYRAGEDEIVVVRVLHGARDFVALAQRGGFKTS